MQRQHCVHDDTIQGGAQITGIQVKGETAIEQAAHVKNNLGATTALIDA